MYKKYVIFFLIICTLLVSCSGHSNKVTSSLPYSEATEKTDYTNIPKETGKDKELELDIADGDVISDGMNWVGSELYYFDINGSIDKTEGWRKIGDDWYYIGVGGYAVRDDWQGTYYLLEDGKMAVDQYIDRFYVGEDGAWKDNNWNEDSWRVDGEWIFHPPNWFFKNTDGELQQIDLDIMRSINRLGYDTHYSKGSMPQQSIVAYQAAIEHGFEILLCDLQFTADNVPVCFHDLDINRIARNADGSELVALNDGEKLTDEMRTFVSETTLEELQQYDYGIYRGAEYAGIKMLTFEEMLSFCRNANINELYIEIKDGTKEQIRKAVVFANSYGIELSWAGSTYDQVKWVVEADSNARVSLMPYKIDNELIDELLSLKTGHNEVFVFAFGNTILTPEKVKLLSDNDISFEMGTIDSEREILNYWNGAYYYCSGIESNTTVASKIDIDNVMESGK